MQKSGFISIIGRPNVGKSTLLNSILSKKVSIISDKPQTTRNCIKGIKNIDGNQLIFLDTPGIHRVARGPQPDGLPPRSTNKNSVKKGNFKNLGYEGKLNLNSHMVETALKTFNSVDLLLVLVDNDERSRSHNEIIFKNLLKVKTPIFLIINKIDLLKKEKLLPLIDCYQKAGLEIKPDHGLWREIIPLSAIRQENVDLLLKKILEVLPEGPHFFPDDISTDQSEKFMVSEFIREKAIDATEQEVPYSLAVIVENIKEGKKGVLVIDALIYVERDSQKGIIIGKKGAKLKEIGTKARADIENLFGMKVFLSLHVKVKKEWTSNKYKLKELGYS